MLPKNSRNVLYALLLIALSVMCTSVVANTRVFSFITEVASAIEAPDSSSSTKDTNGPATNNSISKKVTSSNSVALTAPMFMTIIQGADEEVACTVDGSTLAKFFLCGTNDDRTISAGSGSLEWQKQDSDCALVGTDNCPVNDGTCWNGSSPVASSTFFLDASDPAVAGEYRVRSNGGGWFYFRVTSNPLDPQLVGTDIICGNPGKVEVTNIPAGYEYTIGDPNNAAGYQASPEFIINTPGTYQVHTKLIGASASACIFPSNEVVVSTLDMTVIASRTDISCDGEFGSISVEINDVPGFYTYRLLRDGTTFSTAGPKAGNTQTWNNLGSGTYTIEVTAANSCSATITTIDEGSGPIPITIGQGVTPIDATAYATDSFGCGAASVEIILEVSGGTAPYEYSLDGGVSYEVPTFTTDIRFDVFTPGTYNILVRDAGTCTKDAAVTVVDLPPPVYTYTPQDAACGGVNSGSITANVSNSNGYNLEFSNDNGVTFQNSNVFSNLAPGPYQMVIQYSQDTFTCTTTAETQTVGTPSNIVVSASATGSPSCLNETGGEITFTAASGGSGPYEYSIGSGFVAGNLVFSNLPTGTYSLAVRDANGCVEPAGDIVFAALNKPTDIDFAIVSLDCATGTASVQLTVTGGGPISTYEIIAPSPSNNGASDTFTGLGLGSYTFRVTDNTGCSYDESFAITDISSIGVTEQLLKNVECFGESNGEGRFIVDGFAGTYRYQIDANPLVTGQTNNIINLTGLAAGSYTIVVTDDDTNCSETATLTINNPPSALALNPIWTDMNCQNNNRGRVNANATGGWGGNQYTLNLPGGGTVGPRSNPNFTGLTDTSGPYTVTVTDTFGCSVTSAGHTFTALDFPTLTLDTSDFCFDNVDAATLNVVAAGGDGSYEYSIDGGNIWGPSPSFPGLSPGLYTIEVRDGNDCRDSVSQTIQPQTTTDVSIVRELECTLSGTNDARIRVDVDNGYTPYQHYEVRYNSGAFGAIVPFAGNSFDYDTALDGTYEFRITDARDCQVITNVVTIAPIESIAASANVTEPRCGDPNTGIVELVPDATVGIAPYEYSVDNTVGSYSSQAVFGNLSPGNYTYYVRDSRGCFVAVPFTIGPPTPGLVATVSGTDAICTAGTTFGEIDVTGITDGIAPYNYTVLDAAGGTFATLGPTPSTTANFPNVPQGTYTVIVTDASGCEDRQTVTIDNSGLDLIPVSTTTPPDCSTDPVYIVDIIGGTAPYQIGILGGPLTAPNVDANTHDFTGIVQPGVTYFVEVIDAFGCRYVEQIDPIAGPSLTVTATGTTASCNPGGNGTISYTVSGTTGAQVSVQVINTDTGAIISGPTLFPAAGPFPDITGLPPGNYQVHVEDTTSNCEGEALASIIQDIPTVSIDSNTNANCINPNGQLIVRGNGGTPTYTFSVVDANTPVGVYAADTTYDRPPGTYDVYILDSAGCSSVLEDVVIGTDGGVPTPTIDVVNQCTAVSSYVINVTSPLSSGTAPETNFEYDIGGGFQTSPNFTVANPGTYTIRVRDGNGCENTVNAEVFDFFSITASASSQPSCNNADGIITVETTGGSSNFEFELRESGTLIATQPTNTFSGLPPGDYTILVTDLSSNTIPLCNDTAAVEIITVDTPDISNAVLENVSCNGADDGSISIDLNPATATDSPFTYNLYDGAILLLSQTDAIFDDLAPNLNYEVSVTSSRGCESTRRPAPITEPTALQMDWDAPPFSCDTSVNTFNTTTITIYTDTNLDGSGTPTGTGPYSYSMEIVGNPAFDGTNYQSSNTFEVIDTGSDLDVTIRVRDANGCPISVQKIIPRPSDLNFSFNLITPITCDASGAGVSAGQLEVIIDEGPGNYRIDMLPFSSGIFQTTGGADRAVFNLDTPGDYIFAVSDLSNGGCYYVTPTYTLAEFNVIEAVIAEVQPVTCFNGRDGQISIEVNNYSGLYNWQVFSIDPSGAETLELTSTAPFDTNNPIAVPEIIDGVPAGNLIVRVEALDTPFCDVASNAITVRGPDRALDPTPLQTAPVTCFVPGRGEITVTSEGGWGGYEYSLEIETTPGVFVDYTAPYDTFANNGANNVFEDLSAGTYNVLVRDARGCIEGETITLDLPVQIVGLVDLVQGLDCPGDNDGIIQAINVTGGEDLDGDGEEYLFQLNRLDEFGAITSTSSPQESNQFPNLPSGRYSITIYDGWNCDGVTGEIVIQDPDPVIVGISEEKPPGCGDDSLDIRLSVTNHIIGSGMTYGYRRMGTAGSFIPFPTGVDQDFVIITIPDVTTDVGPFQFEVQNGNGCAPEPSPELPVELPFPLAISLDLVDATIKCYGEATGIIRSEAFGAVGNYRYTLVNNDLGSNIDADPNGVPNLPTVADIVQGPQDSGIFRDLGPGTYWVFASSDVCVTISERIEITPKDELVIDRITPVGISCYNGGPDGSVTIEASGGTGIIRFSISETLSEFYQGSDPLNPNTITFDELAPGDYEVIVVDELGCSILRDITITQPDELIISDFSTTPEICIDAHDGTATLTVQGGTPFNGFDSGGLPVDYYMTRIIGPGIDSTVDPADPDEGFVRNDNLFFDNLQGGENYIIFVRDANDCETDIVVPVEIGVDLAADPFVEYICNGTMPSSTAGIVMQDPSMLPDLMFALDPLDPTDAVTAEADTQTLWSDLDAGVHTVYIYHLNGCSTSIDLPEIVVYEELVLIAEKTGPNEVTASATGGYGNYEFFFQGESTGTETVFNSNESTLVTVEVRDEGGCVATIAIPFEFTGMLEIPNFFTPDGDNNNDFWAPNNREFFPNIEVKIYDRYGRVVAILNQVSSWDGKYEGTELPTGDYWYEVNANDKAKTRYIGHFTLYR